MKLKSSYLFGEVSRRAKSWSAVIITTLIIWGSRNIATLIILCVTWRRQLHAPATISPVPT
jgi:hypothetical protein